MKFDRRTWKARRGLTANPWVPRDELDAFIEHALERASAGGPIDLQCEHPVLGQYRRVIPITISDDIRYVKVEGEFATLYLVAENDRVVFVGTRER